MRILLDPDPPQPPAPGTPPATPKAVAKTPIKTPAEIKLEKEVAALQDKVETFESWQAEVNTALEGLNVGGPPKPAPVKVKTGNVPPVPPPTPIPAPAKKGFLEDLNETVQRDIFGAPKAS